jgi:hypothetical protein
MLGFTLHNSRISKDGRYVVLTPGSSAAANVYVWDTETNQVAALPEQGSGGHRVAGFAQLINHSAPVGDSLVTDGAQWLRRSLSLNQLSSAAPLISPILSPTLFTIDSHLSWNNAQSGVMAPVVGSTYRYQPGSAPFRAWDDEVIAIRTDGQESKVWRFCHHRSKTDPYRFEYTPRGNVSQDGRFYMFTSNWEDTFGPGEFGTNRTDVFVVELAAGAAPPPPTPGDTTSPVVSNVRAASITSSGATVNWDTNEASSTQVEFGRTTAYGSSTALISSLVTSHTATLSGLSPSTLYHYRVRSSDAAGNVTVSPDFTFTTTAGLPGGGGGTASVIWTDLLNCTATGNNLQRTASGGEAGARSQQRITAGDGYVEFRAAETDAQRWCGLSRAGSNPQRLTYGVEFAWQLTPSGIAVVYERGVYKWDTSYASGDVFRVAIASGAVKYFKNGALIYTSAAQPVYPLEVDASIPTLNGTIQGAVISAGAGALASAATGAGVLRVGIASGSSLEPRAAHGHIRESFDFAANFRIRSTKALFPSVYAPRSFANLSASRSFSFLYSSAACGCLRI